MQAILGACQALGRTGYERARARALVLLLRHTALRISDALMLSKDRINNGELMLRTQKSGTMVWLPVHRELQDALDLLPIPRGAARDCKHYFWNEQMGRRALLGIGERAMQRVFELAGVEGGHAHRFRHTLAVDLLEKGATLEDIDCTACFGSVS